MSKFSRTLIGLTLLSFVFIPTLSIGQLRERTRLKTPLLRLPNLGQRQAANGAATPLPLPVASQTANAPTATQTPAPSAIATPTMATATPVSPNAAVPNPALTTPILSPSTAELPAAVPNPPAQQQPITVASANPIGSGRVSAAAIPTESAPTPPAELTPTQTMGLALADADKALQHLRANVRDYTCNFVKRERVGTKLLPTETATIKVRNRVVQNGQIVVPLSVHVKFNGPREIKGREVLYVEGQNKDKLICKEGGTKGRFLPSIWLRQDSSFIMSSNRYPISQIGMTRLAERLIESGRESPVEDCQVKYVHGAKVDGRTCSFLEVIRPTPRPGIPVGHNNVNYAQVFIDTELMMPIRFVAYDWPAKPGERPRLIEQYTYRNIKTNVGLTDKDFSVKNPEYNF